MKSSDRMPIPIKPLIDAQLRSALPLMFDAEFKDPKVLHQGLARLQPAEAAMRLGADDRSFGQGTRLDIVENLAKLSFQVLAKEAALSVIKIGNLPEAQTKFYGSAPVVV